MLAFLEMLAHLYIYVLAYKHFHWLHSVTSLTQSQAATVQFSCVKELQCCGYNVAMLQCFDVTIQLLQCCSVAASQWQCIASVVSDAVVLQMHCLLMLIRTNKLWVDLYCLQEMSKEKR